MYKLYTKMLWMLLCWVQIYLLKAYIEVYLGFGIYRDMVYVVSYCQLRSAEGDELMFSAKDISFDDGFYY